MPSDTNVLLTIVIFLAAMVVTVPIATRVGLGAVLGYLIAGVAIGPHALGLGPGLGTAHGTISYFAELGVVLMLFSIGLELDLGRLWGMRRRVFGLGALQLGACGSGIALAALALGLAPGPAIVMGLVMALSSTAVAVQLMADRNLLGASVGQAVFGVLLFQDLAAIPLLIGVAVWYPSPHAVPFWPVGALLVVAAIIGLSRTLLPLALRFVARHGSRELFVGSALLWVVGIMQVMTAVGVSAGLGAFLAGVLLASSEFRHELEADIAPFKGLFLGLFFITIGAGIDVPLLLRAWPYVLGLLGLFLALKLGLLALVARIAKLPRREQLTFTTLLGQGGEFGFVVVTTAVAGAMLTTEQGAWVSLVIALSIAVTPLAQKLVDRLQAKWLSRSTSREPDHDLHHSPVIIAGFGRYGQIVGRLLLSSGIAPTVLDHDSETIDNMRRFGFKVYYGDATRLDLLETAGAARAQVLVVAVDAPEKANRLCELARQHFPHLTIVARASDVAHWYQLKKLGVTHAQRELFESSLRSGRSVLEVLGIGAYEAREMADRFRTTNVSLLERFAVRRDELEESVFVSEVRRDREELERQLREQAKAPRLPDNWRDKANQARTDDAT